MTDQNQTVIPLGVEEDVDPRHIAFAQQNGNANMLQLHQPGMENAGVWISKIPIGITHKYLFRSFVDCGKIFSVSLSTYDPHFESGAANVIFWNAEGAEKFMEKAREGLICLKGSEPKVTWSRYVERSQGRSNKSRVIYVSGPDSVVSEPHLRGHVFTFPHELEDVEVDVDTDSWAAIEFRFSSVKQAEHAVEAIESWQQRRDIIPMLQYDWSAVEVQYADELVYRVPQRVL
ncbi:hypothetical protein GGS24DRAFT_514681 [Hypoxylon argillaceum]|nr:hypothetical protein GGS24DRAFT_514681 [Hypoxylon argillaceum]